MIFALATAIFALPSSTLAMDRWSALSMIESGDNDHAVGRNGEVSRYQILPALWPGGNPQNGQEALSAARAIMGVRLAHFRKVHQRPANDFEFYILWNAPWEASHPSRAVSERARRYANLVEAGESARR